IAQQRCRQEPRAGAGPDGHPPDPVALLLAAAEQLLVAVGPRLGAGQVPIALHTLLDPQAEAGPLARILGRFQLLQQLLELLGGELEDLRAREPAGLAEALDEP